MSNIKLEQYSHHLDGFDLTDEQKLELINTLEMIVENKLLIFNNMTRRFNV